MSLGSARVYRVNIRKAQNLAQEFQPIRVPHTEQLSVAGLLTATGGFLDAFTFVGHGHVFANSMTGNVVLLGLAAGTGDRGGIWWHLVPILAFMMGVAVAQFIRLTLQSGPVGRAEQISLWLEISFLSLVALLPHELSHEAIILGIAFCSGCPKHELYASEGRRVQFDDDHRRFTALCRDAVQRFRPQT